MRNYEIFSSRHSDEEVVKVNDAAQNLLGPLGGGFYLFINLLRDLDGRHLTLLSFSQSSSCLLSSLAYSAHPSRCVPSVANHGCPHDSDRFSRSLRVMSTYNQLEWVRLSYRPISMFPAHYPAARGFRSRLVLVFLTRYLSHTPHACLVLQRTN